MAPSDRLKSHSTADRWLRAFLICAATGIMPQLQARTQINNVRSRNEYQRMAVIDLGMKPPHRSLCSIGGGRLTVRRNDDGDFQLTVPRVNAFIELDAAKSLQLFTGQRATVTLGPGTRPVAGYIAKQLGW